MNVAFFTTSCCFRRARAVSARGVVGGDGGATSQRGRSPFAELEPLEPSRFCCVAKGAALACWSLLARRRGWGGPFTTEAPMDCPQVSEAKRRKHSARVVFIARFSTAPEPLELIGRKSLVISACVWPSARGWPTHSGLTYSAGNRHAKKGRGTSRVSGSGVAYKRNSLHKCGGEGG